MAQKFREISTPMSARVRRSASSRFRFELSSSVLPPVNLEHPHQRIELRPRRAGWLAFHCLALRLPLGSRRDFRCGSARAARAILVRGAASPCPRPVSVRFVRPCGAWGGFGRESVRIGQARPRVGVRGRDA